jgi:hypothetical protein
VRGCRGLISIANAARVQFNLARISAHNSALRAPMARTAPASLPEFKSTLFAQKMYAPQHNMPKLYARKVKSMESFASRENRNFCDWSMEKIKKSIPSNYFLVLKASKKNQNRNKWQI